MTLKERLQSIGRSLIGEPQVHEIDLTPKKKGLIGAGYVDVFNPNQLVGQKRISNKLLKANYGWVYRNNDVIAKEVSQIEFELFTIKVVGKEIVLNPIIQHPLLDALDKFNEFTAASDGFYLTTSHRNLAGDCFWYVEGKGPNIENIFLLQPDKIELKFGDTKGGTRVISSYDFQDSIDGKTIKETYEPEEIIHFKLPNPENPYRGKSKVEAAAEEIDIDNYATEANKNMFKKGMISNFVLSTPNRLTPEQVKEIEAKLRANYAGARNAYKAMILSGGLEPKSIQMSNKDMELIAQQAWFRDKIMSVFGNNKGILGITDDVNRANAEASILIWKQTTLKAEMRGITDTLNEFLTPRFGSNLLLTFKDPVPEDQDGKITQATSLVNAKIITQNEAREMLGYEPVKEEDANLLNKPVPEFNGVPIKAPKSVFNIDYQKMIRRSGAVKQIKKLTEIEEAARPIAERIIKSRRKTKVKNQEPRLHPRLTNDQVMTHYQKQIRVVEAAEEIFQNKVKKFIDKLVDKAIGKVPEEIAQIQKKQLFDENEVVQATLDFTPILNDVATLSAQQTLRLIGDDMAYLPKDVRPIIERNVAKFAESMIETDRDKIVDIIAQGLLDGRSIPEIRKNITETFEEYSKVQAERITRTEVLRASNIGTLDAFKQSDVVVGKQWLTAGATDECAAYEGKIVYDLDGNFYSPDNEFEDGDPPIHPNCRCILLPVLEHELATDNPTL